MGKDLKGSGRCLIQVKSHNFRRGSKKKARKTSARKVGVLDEIRTENLLTRAGNDEVCTLL